MDFTMESCIIFCIIEYVGKLWFQIFFQVDEQCLKQQVDEKKERDDLERRRDEAYGNWLLFLPSRQKDVSKMWVVFPAADAVRNDKIACLLQRRQEADIRALNKALNEFRALHQQPCSRREWDLYDPDHLKKDKPARVSDDDPRCHISGLQKFDGEDLNNKARNKFQKEQSREWFEKQAKDRAMAEAAQKEAERSEAPFSFLLICDYAIGSIFAETLSDNFTDILDLCLIR